MNKSPLCGGEIYALPGGLNYVLYRAVYILFFAEGGILFFYQRFFSKNKMKEKLT